MIDSVGIYRKANSLVQLHGTRDTIKLAEASGVEVVPVDCSRNVCVPLETSCNVSQQ